MKLREIDEKFLHGPKAMTDVAPTPSTAPLPIPPEEIDASCRLPLFVMFVSAAVWLLIGSAFGLISTLKFHNPSFLADISWLTYGRTHPAYLNSIVYGFCLQAGLGVALWLIARLGRTFLIHRWVVTIGGILWNLGVTVGVVGILAGDSTGFEYLEMPRYAAMIIFFGYLLVGIWTVMVFHRRRERALFVSQWFLLASLFWFPWIYSTGYLLLVAFPVRGVAQAVVGWWFANNLLGVWLGLAGLAALFYFVPKLTHTELHSRYLALFAFWMLLLIGSWGGIPNTAPVPAWMPALSTVATVLTVLVLLTVALNLFGTLRGQAAQVRSNVPLQFLFLGFVGFLLAGLMNILSVLPQFGLLAHFTWFTAARAHATFYAFFSFVMFGAIYYILPHLAGLNFPSTKPLRLHLWLALLGILLIILPQAIGGLFEGLNLQNPSIAFLQVSKRMLPFLRASTLGDLLLAAGHVLFVMNVAGLVSRFAKARATAAYGLATADLFKTAEAKP